MMTNPAEIMKSFQKEQLNPMSTPSVNFLEALPDVVFYEVMKKLPARVIENCVRLLSRDCYRRVELRRARLPRVYFEELHVDKNQFYYDSGARNKYRETIDPVNLMQHLEYLGERTTFKTLSLMYVNWEMFANCKFECKILICFVDDGTTLSPERFMDMFCSIRPTQKLTIYARGKNFSVFPVTSDFFTNDYAVGLQEVWLEGWGNDPLNDTILLNSRLLRVLVVDFPRTGCTLNGIQTWLGDWFTSGRQIDRISLRAVGGEAELQKFLHNLSGWQNVKLIGNKPRITAFSLKRANGDVIKVEVDRFVPGYCESGSFGFCVTRKVPCQEGDLAFRRIMDNIHC